MGFICKKKCLELLSSVYDVFAALKERGHEFHEAVRNAVLSRSSEGCHSDVTRNALRSLEWVLGLVTNPLAVESIIAHPRLQYKGIPDCVAMFR